MKENVKLMLYIQAIKNNIEKKSLNKRFQNNEAINESFMKSTYDNSSKNILK